jgi:AcrR family transcriptional regulator
MGRPPRFAREQIVEAAKQLVAEGGARAATVSAIARRVGAPTGSFYHRYESRELLLAEIWFGVIEAFQAGLIDALGGENTRDAGLRAALHSVEWVRAHPLESRLLLLHRKEDFVAGKWPAALRRRAKSVNDEANAAIADYTRRHFGRCTAANLRRAKLAIIDIPYGALKRHVEAEETPPAFLDDLVRAASGAVLT